MIDIVERLRFDAARCELQFSRGVAGNIEEAAAEIERLRAAPEQLAKMIEGFSPGQIRMAAGEMTSQEMRTVRAVQRWWVSAMRHKAEQLVNQQRTPSERLDDLKNDKSNAGIR